MKIISVEIALIPCVVLEFPHRVVAASVSVWRGGSQVLNLPFELY